VVTVILAAFAVGLGNLAVAIGVGLSGVDARTRIRIAVIFGVFEGGMPVVGLLIGHGVASDLGSVAGYVGGALLIAIGIWSFVRHRRGDGDQALSTGWAALILTALALSIDNLIVGFGLGAANTPLIEALIVFTSASVLLTVVGLQAGRRLAAIAQLRSDALAAVVLVCVGVLLEFGVL
jgi:putative Mn2+ efflux pump MntP